MANENQVNDDREAASTGGIPGSGGGIDDDRFIYTNAIDVSKFKDITPSSTTVPVDTRASNKVGLRTSNPLAKYASSTYQLSLYVITPAAYKTFVLSGRKNLNALNSNRTTKDGAYLIAQSGGINNESYQRAPNMPYDYYIDDLRMTQVLMGKDTGAPSNVTDVNFKIYEPVGFSFISRLTQLQRAVGILSSTPAGTDGLPKNATRQFFILGIRFYGYDINGNIDSDQYERYYDIVITSMKYRLDGKTTVYDVTGVTTPVMAFDAKYGRIINGIECYGSTVGEILNGEHGLITILNQRNIDDTQTLYPNESPSREIANKYSVVFVGNGAEANKIPNSTVILGTDKNIKNQSGDWQANKSKNVSEVGKSTPNLNVKKITFAGDTSIQQAISNIIKQSSYMTDALKVLETNSVSASEDGAEQNSNKDNETLKWYNLSAEITPIGWDSIRHDWALDIKYIIQPYDAPAVTVAQVIGKPGKYYGAHKKYKYWFTGENSEILSYEHQLNNQFYYAASVITGDSAGHGHGADIPAHIWRTLQERLGSVDKGTEIQNMFVNELLSPGDWVECKIQIIGDPDFLMPDYTNSINEVYNKFYGNDFRISPNGGQVFVEIDFKEGVDYDHRDGLMEINDQLSFWNYSARVKKRYNIEGVSYLIRTVISSFRQGKFVQDLIGTINTFPEISDKNATSQERYYDIYDMQLPESPQAGSGIYQDLTNSPALYYPSTGGDAVVLNGSVGGGRSAGLGGSMNIGSTIIKAASDSGVPVAQQNNVGSSYDTWAQSGQDEVNYTVSQQAYASWGDDGRREVEAANAGTGGATAGTGGATGGTGGATGDTAVQSPLSGSGERLRFVITGRRER